MSLISKLKHKINLFFFSPTYNFDSSKRLIGIMMIRNENDMLKETLTNITQIYDRIFVLDGTEPDDDFLASKTILDGFDEIKLIIRDKDTPGPFPIRDGARRYLLEKVREKYGINNWIGVLHGDELYSRDPRSILHKINPHITPVIQVHLCHFFLHTTDKNNWENSSTLPVEERVTYYMWPGTPEDRLFYDKGNFNYDPSRHSLVVPSMHLHERILLDDFIIKQYNYRNPEQMSNRASQRIMTSWQRNHYEHIQNDKLFFVDSLHVPGYKPCGSDNVIEPNKNKWSKPRSKKDFPLPYLNSPITPIFIGGTGRTGSTYVKQLLGNHDKLFALNWESKFISYSTGLMDLLYDFSENKLQAFLNNMSNSNKCTYPEYEYKEINNWLFRALNGKTSVNENFHHEQNYLVDGLADTTLPFFLKSDLVEQFVHFLFDRFAISGGAVAWVEQTPRNINWACELLQCFKNSFFIFVFRDPRDVIASLIPLWWGPKTIEECVEYYKERFTIWKKSKDKILENNLSGRIFELGFEEIINSNGDVLDKVLTALDLPECHFLINKESAHLGRWRTDFNIKEQEMISCLLRDELKEQGYT